MFLEKWKLQILQSVASCLVSCVVVGGTLQSEALGTESEEQSVRVIINILQTSDLDRVVTMAV